MKKILLLITVLLTAINASAYDFEADGFYFNILSATDLSCAVTYKEEYKPTYSGDVVIPSTVTFKNRTLTVTMIDEEAFYYCNGMTSVEIPNSVTEIGSCAFYGCRGLTSIVIPNSVTTIGIDAFSNCSSLKSIEIPNSVTSIGKRAFYRCNSLTSVEIPNSVTEIGYEAFYFCKGLTSVVIPNSVTEIGTSAFNECSGLTSIEIPNSVTEIGDYAFSHCTSLASVVMPSSVTEIGVDAFRETNVIDYICDNEKYISYFNPKNLTLGEHVNSITSSLKDISILEKLTVNNCVPPTFTVSTPFTDKQLLNVDLYVPEDALEAYQKDKVWGNFWSINTFEFVNAINGIAADKPLSGKAYDLRGMEVGEGYKGIVIQNGKKMLRR